MELLHIAFFIIQLLYVNTDSPPIPLLKSHPDIALEPISCDDPDVLAGVDFSLRKLNANLTSGHKFALHYVFRARAKELQGKIYSIDYFIQETDCPVGNETIWKECNIRPRAEATMGHCKLKTFIEKLREKAEITEYNCTINSGNRPRPPCPGCPRHQLDHPKLNEIIALAVAKFNTESNYTNYFQHDIVFTFTYQVVAGMKYELKFTIQETECSKEDSNIRAANCDAKADGEKMFCHSEVITQIWMNYTAVDITCTYEPFPTPMFDAFQYVGWGPFGVSELLQEQTEQVTDRLVFPKCPGKTWKPLPKI
ncbi:kininogen-1-like [Chiloscyllium plagiosum]|uniref:kininogen-1-like n=1 Tax=Chiloscyllium plagiosum TaxID=36176 RepID=UPI001CB7C48C|nr:kininogen-1-like [Chiloscyllium plagiosum]